MLIFFQLHSLAARSLGTNVPVSVFEESKGLMMKKLLLVVLICVGVPLQASAQNQVLPNGTVSSALSIVLLPIQPTSSDNLRLMMPNRSCPNGLIFTGNPYRVTMANQHITITLGPQANPGVVSPPVCPPTAAQEIDLGRLPAGSYTMSLVDPVVNPPHQTFSNVAFTVTDGRANKVAPFVRLDYSGHWWDPNDAGWGLFVWHDAKDNVLAAWFTYGADGKPIWWVFQPTWQFTIRTFDADLVQTSRLPGPTSPPPNPTSVTVVGKARLEFGRINTADEVGSITYTIGNGPTITRTIQRFKP